jgi:hypothetical protein
MSQAYKQCTTCGARALRIATRCPGCHREFPRAEPAAGSPAGSAGRGQPRFSRPSGLAAGVLAVATILIVTELAQSGSFTDEAPTPAAADSAAARAEVAYASDGGTVAAARESAAAARPSRPEVKVARTWTSVRKAPRKGAELEAVLTPGDTVLADSLQRGWYRVALDGEVLGYAYGSSLAAADSTRSGDTLTP